MGAEITQAKGCLVSPNAGAVVFLILQLSVFLILLLQVGCQGEGLLPPEPQEAAWVRSSGRNVVRATQHMF